MKKIVFASAALAVFSLPALADNMMMPCTNANIHKTEMMAKGMNKPEQKTSMMMAMDHVKMAKEMKMHHKKHECMMELDSAMKAMHG
ncbi:MAG: hypothetical protein U1E15_03005 [Hyphomicrobiales bacterium]